MGMNFVWMLGSGSVWQNWEIRYSIRSVVKHHPDANIYIIGERPAWYTGDNHHYVPDADECPYVNVWNKLEYACKLVREFVQMDDDFFLLQPYRPIHYMRGTLLQYMERRRRRIESQHWVDVTEATYQAMPEANRHLLHIPLPIISKNFMRIAKKYPQRKEHPSLVPRQIYCHHETAFEVQELERDVKVSRIDKVKHMPFFSANDNVYLISRDLVKLYPEPSPYEDVNYV